MKKNFTFILMWLLCVFSLNTRAQTQFWSDTFEANPTAGTRTPEGTGGIGTPVATSYFKLTDGSTISQVVPFTGKEGSNYWAGEDHNATETGLPSAGAPTDDILNELQINWTGINIAGKSGISFKGLFAANSTSQAWDNKNACLSGVATTNTDYIIVEYQIDGGTWTSLIRFFNKGSASDIGLAWKNLYEDTDDNGCGDGIMLTNSFGEFTKNIGGTGSVMNLRIRVYSEGNNEEWGIDNFRLLEETTCVPPVVTLSPLNSTICAGENTTFSAIASNATGYQWQVSTGSEFANITNGGVYSNATTNILTITGATAGMNGYQYRCKVINGGASCFVNSNAATLNVSNMTITTLTKVNVQCFGDNNGSASLSTSGGIAPYTYSWAPSGGTGSSASGLAPGTYTVTVQDYSGCTKEHQVVINGPTAALSATTSTTAVSCFLGTNGTATVTPAGGTGTKTYLWSNGATTATATGLEAGTYSVTVKDANLCSVTVPGIVVGGPTAAVSGTYVTTPVSCFGGNNGSATVTPAGGVGGYTYSWSPSGGSAAIASSLTAGTYSVTITDNNGCPTTVTGIVVGGPTAGLTAIASTTAVSCFGASNGSATITVSGGTGTKTYLWSNGATTATASGLVTGTYSVTVTDADSCSRTFNNILVGSVTAIIAHPTQVNVACNGGNTGSATVAPTGGSGNYTYLWNTGATASTISNLTAGNYSVTITDSFSCSATQAFTITQPPVLALSGRTINNVSCNNGTNGAATVIATGGAGGYTYSWSPRGGTAATASGLAAGTYTVTVTDANACQKTLPFTITEPAALVVTSSQVDILCNGSATGSATVNVTGGTGTPTYSWSPSGGTAATATGLTAGTYTVTISDANTCSTTQSFTIIEPAALTASAAAKTNIACNGATTGSATVSATGGTGGYTYSWAPSGGTAATASGLAAGTYTVTVTDANLCFTTQSFTITQPPALSATTASTGVSCFGGSNGSASVTVSGGTPAYTYLWAPLGETTASISGRLAGDYTCTITDANGCTLVKTVTISSPAQFSATVSKTDVSCKGGSNGTATVTPSGATAPYSYTWTPFGGSNATASGLSAGTYNVIVQDANTCQYPVTVTIDQPTALTATSSQINVSCFEGTNGSASVVASGGTHGYNYLWSPSGGTAATATGLSAGNYSVLITDSNGCFTTRSFTITQPTVLMATTSQIDATCSTGGQAAVNVSGGALPYSYLWSNGATTQIVTGLAAGNYSCVITDANRCTLTKNFIINTTNTLVATTSQTDVSCNGANTGSASVVPSGAPGPFTYVWSPSGGNSDTASNLRAGNYSVTITSANGCSIVKSFTITQPAAILSATTASTGVSCFRESNGSASVTVSGGTPAYTYLWAPLGGTTASISGRPAGDYTCTITDANGCTLVKTITISSPAQFSATVSKTDVSCNGESNGTATVTATGGTGAYTYSWAPSGGNAATASGLAIGTYTVTVTDANTCQTTASVTIAQPTALTATSSQINVSCFGDTNGSASVVASGGTHGYTYLWSPSGGTAATATGLSAGNYSVLITDSNSCFTTRSFTIAQPTNALVATASAQTNVSCNDGTNGSATVTASGGTPGYTYSWSPSGGTAATATGLAAGTYTVTVTDANACTKTQSFTITQPTVMSFTTTTLPGYDYSQPYTQTILATGGTGTKTYAVTSGNLPTGFSLSSSGVISGSSTQVADSNFIITATDANSCSVPYNFELKLNQIPITITANASQSKVYGENDPTLTFTASPNLLPGDSFTGALERILGENVGSSYQIEQGSLSAGDKYLIIYNSNNFSITAKPITVTATAKNKIYGDPDPALTYTFVPALVAGDSFTGALTRLPGENVGTYAINQNTLALNSNYTLAYVGANVAITAKPITVTAVAKTKTYGDVDPALTYTHAPALVGTDAFTGSLTRAVGQDAAVYPITQGNLSAGSNYAITYLGATFTIGKANQTITWSQVLESGCDGENTAILTATTSSGLAVNYVSSNTNIATVSNGLLTYRDYGAASLTASQPGNKNYNAAAVVVLPLVNVQPNLIRKQFSNIIFFDNSSKSFISYTWYKNGVLVPGQTAQHFKENGDLNGIYYAKATRLDGMVVTTCELTLSPSIEEEYINLAPNPVKPNRSYELLTNVATSKLQNARIEVYNATGTLVTTKTTSQNTVSLNAPTVEGIYVVKMTLANGKIFTKNLLVKN